MSWGKGQQVNNGRYEILDRIGTGGFGVTYKAIDLKHPTPNSIVAIKTLNEKRQRQANFEQLQENFLNEAMALAKCSHPHVIRVDRVFPDGQLWAMVMDYIEGESLEDYLIERGKLPETKAVEIIQKIGGAVSYVHAQRLLHRDIKPANILIKPNGEPILIDFGLAREFVAGIARSMTSDRTPHYSPPEQAERRGDFQPRLDVYALAATLYTCVTGDLPQMAEIRIVRDSLMSPQQLNSGISDRVNQAILTGMALKPEDRSSTVEKWLDLLPPTSMLQDKSTPEQFRNPIRGDDLRLESMLSFQEAILGCQKIFKIPRLQICKTCNENGFQIFKECYVCGGCRRVLGTDSVIINIPPQVDNGQVLRLLGKGDDGLNGGAAGDTLVYLLVNEDEQLKRTGDLDILSTIEITQSQADCGCEIDIATIDATVSIKIPPQTKNGATLRLRNRGVPKLGDPLVRGDHLVTVKVEKSAFM